MIRRKYILIISFLLTALYACNYLDEVPNDIATIDYAFRDRDRAQRYLATCYSFLPNFGFHKSNPALSGGDEIWFTSETTDPGNGRYLARGAQKSDNPYFDFWQGSNGGTPLFQGIRDCNIFLDKIEGVPDISVDEKARWISEVKFLKAFYHFYLLRMFGPIPLMDKNIEVSSSIDAAKVYRTPFDSCVNYIVHLLDEAAAVDPNSGTSYLPLVVSDPNNELGRITLPIVYAVKAQVLMTAASPLFNGDSYNDVVDSRGIHLFPTAFNPAKWVRAAQACDTAIKVCHTAGYKLLSPDQPFNGIPLTALNAVLPYLNSLSSQTKLGIMLRGVVSERWNSEIIWGCTVPNTDGYSYQQTGMPHLNVPNTANKGANYGVPFKIAAEFYTQNGVPINEDKTWDYANRFKLQNITPAYKYYLINGEQTVKFNFSREPRFYAWLGFDRGMWYGQGFYNNDTACFSVRMRYGEPQYPPQGNEYASYYPKKLVNFQNYWANSTSGTSMIAYSFPIIRLAELYLYYAEALNETGDIENAKLWVDKIRARAGLADVKTSWVNFSTNPGKPTTVAGMRDIIQRETLIEMSFEGARFWDLRRWKLCEQEYSIPVQLWNNKESSATGYYVLQTLYNQSFSFRDYLWPIPVSEINVNPNLVQNKGW